MSGIRVLLAEDSPTVRYYLTSIIEEVPGMQVVGTARNGEEAVEMTEKLRPDVISMDIMMPRVDGLEATRQIMTRCPTPIVVVSGLVENDIDLSFRAMQSGALAVVAKPPDRRDPAFPEKRHELIKTLQAMAGVKVISRRDLLQQRPDTGGLRAIESERRRITPELIAIGASTGGPSALSRLLAALPADLPVPVLVVQHMPHEFIPGLARWLDKVSPLQVQVAANGHELKPGVVHLSPGSAHLTVIRRGGTLVLQLLREKGDYRYQPSVDVLFGSVARACGSAAIGVVMTGMGDDGARGLLAMRDAGAYTLAQNEASSTVFGMPAAAVERGAAERVVALDDLPAAILKLI